MNKLTFSFKLIVFCCLVLIITLYLGNKYKSETKKKTEAETGTEIETKIKKLIVQKDVTSDFSANKNDSKNINNFLKLYKVLGTTYIIRGGKQTRLEGNTVLKLSDIIVTGDRGFVSLILIPGNSIINITSNSSFKVINALRNHKQNKDAYSFELLGGKIISYVNRILLKTDVKILSANSIIAIRGTVFMLQNDGEKTLVYLKKGSVNVYNQNKLKESLVINENNHAVINNSNPRFKAESNSKIKIDENDSKILNQLFYLEVKNDLILEKNNKMDGTGTIEDPYLIDTYKKLQAIGLKENLEKSFKQTSNIDLRGKNFIPIGIKNQPFKGNFDGNNFVIQNLSIIGYQSDNLGLFGFSSLNAVIKNIKLKNVFLKGQSKKIGGIVGWNNGTVMNAYVSGEVMGGSYYAGGIVGYNNNEGKIINSVSAVNVTGINQVGGITGYNGYGGFIKNSYFKGSVSGFRRVGGLVGLNDSSGRIESSFSVGKVKGEKQFGGLVGSANGGSTVRSFWDIDVSGLIVSSGGIGQSTENIKKDEIIDFFSFDRQIWKKSKVKYPQLFWE